MMFGQPAKFEKEFIERTKQNLAEYSKGNGPYEITQFINSMLGLLIIPKEKHYSAINDSMIDPGLLARVFACCKAYDNKPLSLQYVANHMRNATSHGHLLFEAEKDPFGKVGTEIARITFTDINPQTKNKTFEAKFDINLLKGFVLAFADAIAAIV